MSDIGPWLVVGGAALVVVCAGLALAFLLRAFRRTTHTLDVVSARTTLADAAAEGTRDDDRLMPLLLGAAIEASSADAAVVTFVRRGDRRRSYSVDLDAHEARVAIHALVTFPVSELTYERYEGALRAGLVLPVEQPGVVTGALAVYWRDDDPPDPSTANLEELVDAIFGPRSRRAETSGREWSKLADLNATLDPTPLLGKIVDAALDDCGADAAAARIGGATGEAPASTVERFVEEEREWAESVLATEPAVPSITRYIAPRARSVAQWEAPIATAIVVPLRDPDGNAVGNLVAAWRRDLAADADRKVRELELLADDARAAVGNAARFQRLQSTAFRDASTGLYDRRRFVDLLAGAVETARRSSRPLVLLLFSASEIAPVEADVNVAAVEEALVEGSARIAEAIGELGVACRVGLGEFTAILPDVDLADGRAIVAELTQELPRGATGEARLRWSASAVELDESESADELWQRARRTLRPDAISPDPHTTVTTPAVGPVRLSVGGSDDDWTFRARPPGDTPGPER